MPKLFDWNCQACDAIVELWDTPPPQCPYCGSKNLQKVYITPPGKLSRSTKFMDDGIKELTRVHGMTDYQNDPSRTHDKKSGMQVTGFDPGKQIDVQVADQINKMRGPVPFNHPKMGHVTNIPVLDPQSGTDFKTIMDSNRRSNYRRDATHVIAGIDRNKKEYYG